MWVKVTQALPDGKTCTNLVNLDTIERVTDGFAENAGVITIIFASGKTISIKESMNWLKAWVTSNG